MCRQVRTSAGRGWGGKVASCERGTDAHRVKIKRAGSGEDWTMKNGFWKGSFGLGWGRPSWRPKDLIRGSAFVQ